MHPVFYKALPGRAFALRDFILVMREGKVFTAKMQVKTGAEVSVE